MTTYREEVENRVAYGMARDAAIPLVASLIEGEVTDDTLFVYAPIHKAPPGWDPNGISARQIVGDRKPWINCPECGFGPGQSHTRACTRGPYGAPTYRVGKCVAS